MSGANAVTQGIPMSGERPDSSVHAVAQLTRTTYTFTRIVPALFPVNTVFHIETADIHVAKVVRARAPIIAINWQLGRASSRCRIASVNRARVSIIT